MTNRFLVRLHGENFRLLINGAQRIVGFFTTRYIDASDTTDAAKKAIYLVMNEPKIMSRTNSENEPPRLTAEEVIGVQWYAKRLFPPKGYTFYCEEDEPIKN